MKLSSRLPAPEGILIVDDDIRRHRVIMAAVCPKPTRIFHAYDAGRAIKLLAVFRNRIGRVFLNFDQFGEPGMTVAKYMIDHGIGIPVTVVSVNPVGHPIVNELRKAGFEVTSHPIVLP